MGFLPCLYDYYYNFFAENNGLKSEFQTIFNRDWKGYIFSFNNEQFFWGLDSSYLDFLWEHIFGRLEFDVRGRYWRLNNQYIDQENYDGKIEKKIFAFFKKQETNSQGTQEDYASVGKDGFILCRI
jgi:hypothetical protein